MDIFTQVNLLVSRLHMGEYVIGELLGLKAQMLMQADYEAFSIVNYIDSIIKLFS